MAGVSHGPREAPQCGPHLGPPEPGSPTPAADSLHPDWLCRQPWGHLSGTHPTELRESAAITTLLIISVIKITEIGQGPMDTLNGQ